MEVSHLKCFHFCIKYRT